MLDCLFAGARYKGWSRNFKLESKVSPESNNDVSMASLGNSVVFELKEMSGEGVTVISSVSQLVQNLLEGSPGVRSRESTHILSEDEQRISLAYVLDPVSVERPELAFQATSFTHIAEVVAGETVKKAIN